MIFPRDALEAALVRTPDDTALHMAYADCLLGDGGPRGEYLRRCLAAEEPSATKKERKRRREHAQAFQHRHEAAWLGDPAAPASAPWATTRAGCGGSP